MKSFWRDRMQILGSVIDRLTDGMANYGGCCVIAAAVGRALEKQGVKVLGGAVVKGWMDAAPNLAYARSAVDSLHPVAWNKVGVTFRHVLIVFHMDGKNWVWDTETLQEWEHYRNPTYEDFLTVDEMEGLSSVAEGWNPIFDRDTIPAIVKEINKAIAKVTP